MKLRTILIMLVCAFSTTLFSFAQEGAEDVVKIHCLNLENKELKKRTTYKNIRILELEKAPLTMTINKVKSVEMNDEYIFIQSGEALYTYTHDGQLVAQIGKEGSREGEYSSLSSFYLNNSKKEIGIIDRSKNRLLHYNFWGNYLFTDTVPKGVFQWCYQTLMTADKLLNYKSLSMNDEKAYSLFDLEKKEIVGQYFPYHITLGNYVQPFAWRAMAQSGKDIDFIMPLCDTVYTYQAASSSFKPKYSIETPQKMASKSGIRKHTPSYSEDILKLNQEGYFTGFTGIFETNTKVLLLCNGPLRYFLFDKSSQEGFYTSFNENRAFPFYELVCTYKNEFVACEKAEVLRRIQHLGDEKIKKQVEELRNNSTCLIFYNFE